MEAIDVAKHHSKKIGINDANLVITDHNGIPSIVEDSQLIELNADYPTDT